MKNSVLNQFFFMLINFLIIFTVIFVTLKNFNDFMEVRDYISIIIFLFFTIYKMVLINHSFSECQTPLFNKNQTLIIILITNLILFITSTYLKFNKKTIIFSKFYFHY